MKLLLVHNFYRSGAPSGENQVLEAEKLLLESHGHQVVLFARHSDEIQSSRIWGSLKGAAATPWNPWMYRAMNEAIAQFRPDVVHVHNTFPLISPAIFHAAGRRTARVLTLHNYRLFCSAAIPLRGGKVCTDCLDRRSSWPAVRHGCYRGSRVATLPLAVGVELHRRLRTWADQVDAFIALTDFQRELMIDAGLPPTKVRVKPNFYSGRPQVIRWGDRGSYVVFVGRLSAEKGVADLLQAWQKWGETAPELRLVGDGALRSELEQGYRSARATFLGQLSPSEAEAQIASARLLVLPSVCFEGFPMVLREAFAFGTPAAVSEIGPLPSIVQHNRTGVVFRPADPDSLLDEVRRIWYSTETLREMGRLARAEFEAKYTEEANYQMLMRIYEAALANSRGHA